MLGQTSIVLKTVQHEVWKAQGNEGNPPRLKKLEDFQIPLILQGGTWYGNAVKHSHPKHLQQVVECLLERGADPEFCDQDGFSSLFLCLCYTDSLHLLKTMLRFAEGADCGEGQCNVKGKILGDRCYRSMVDYCLLLGRGDLLPFVLENEGMPTLWGSGETKLWNFAQLHGCLPLAEKLMKEAMFKCILGESEEAFLTLRAIVKHGDCKVLFATKDESGRKPLQIVVHSKLPNLEMVEFLCENGADPNSKDKSGMPLAVVPVLRNSKQARACVSLLLRHGLDPQSMLTDPEEGTMVTLLHFARSSCSSKESVKLLEDAVERAEEFAKDIPAQTPDSGVRWMQRACPS